MKTIGIVLALGALAFAEVDIKWNSLRVKWVPTVTVERDAHYIVPRTLREAKSEGWVRADCVYDLNVSAYCLPDDPIFCVLLDANGIIAGVQTGVLVSDVAYLQTAYNMSGVNMFRRRTLFKKDVWTCTYYTVSPEIIQAGGRKEFNNLTGTEGAWMETTDGYLHIPKNQSDLDPIWKKETCIDGMGTHFYFNTSVNQDCATIKPLFPTYINGQLISIGWFVLGVTTIKNLPWVEKIPEQMIELINPEGPTCLYAGIKMYGLLSMHIYFIDDPWNISCPF